jgi:outer membrane protein OmpA-like peptidoglycan-associated protein
MKHLLIFAALTAGAANAQYEHVSAAGHVVTNGYGEAWQTPHSKAERATRVRFEFDRADLTAEGRKALDGFAQRVFEGEVGSIVTTAHADRLGTPDYNLELSARRAHVVREYLIEQGVLPSVLMVDVVGAAAPVAACDGMGEESARNLKLVACLEPDRRVEVRAR